MRNVILFILLLTCWSLSAQDNENPDFKKVHFGFGMALNFESLDEAIADEVGVSSTGFTLIDFRGRLSILKYVVVDIGGSVSQFKDELPFSEAVIFTSGPLQGLPNNATSKIVSGSWYYSVGARAPLTKRLFLNGHFGKRNYSASRTIPECSNCMKTDIDLEAGTYLRGGLSWLTFEESVIGEVDLLYTHYLDGGFKSTYTLGFFIYF